MAASFPMPPIRLVRLFDERYLAAVTAIRFVCACPVQGRAWHEDDTFQRKPYLADGGWSRLSEAITGRPETQ